MNRFDEKYEIRLARYDEIEEIMEFIDQNWRKGHILGNDRAFFEYEHVIDGQVTFILAKDRKTLDIHGILGYLPASRNRDKYDIWGVVWKVKEKEALPMLGIELKKRLVECIGARTDLGTGANPKTAVPLLKMLLHYKVGKMKHYYVLSEREEYKIAEVKRQKRPSVKGNPESTFVERFNFIEDVIEKYDFTVSREDIPYKDSWYINRRYYRHPVYRYMVYGLFKEKDGRAQALLVCREQEYEGTCVLRIVDYIGNRRLFAGLRAFIDASLKKYEYIDFYCYGFEENYILEAGFTLLDDSDDNIIPNYFQPFERKNIDIWVNSSRDGCLFFKADGDQDRPN